MPFYLRPVRCPGSARCGWCRGAGRARGRGDRSPRRRLLAHEEAAEPAGRSGHGRGGAGQPEPAPQCPARCPGALGRSGSARPAELPLRGPVRGTGQPGPAPVSVPWAPEGVKAERLRVDLVWEPRFVSSEGRSALPL